MGNRYAIILCGGSGTRLWPLSRSLKPKHLLPLNGESTLLQQTALRVCQKIPASRLITVTHESHRFEVKGQLAEILPDAVDGVMAEPIAKNTLAAIAIAVRRIHDMDPTAIIGVFASDHAIDDEKAFIAAWDAAEVAADAGYLALLGIKPTEAATGYGYIKPGASLNLGAASLDIHAVKAFVEKPNHETAASFVQEGYLWNSGMFVFRADAFMEKLARYQPDISAVILAITDANITQQYEKLPSLSMDNGLVELCGKVAVVPVDMAWSDLGSWDSIYARHAKDSDNNVTHGAVVSLDTKNSLVWTETGLVATLGLDNVVVIQTADATLVCDRSRAEDIKALVAEVKTRQPALTEIHQTVFRPWGSYTVLEERANFKIKRIVVNPGAKLSLQMHHHRSEHWVVVSGVATISNNGIEFILQENQSTYIPQTHQHRLANQGTAPLSIIEVQCGAYVGEDDIVRFDDHYGRTTTQ